MDWLYALIGAAFLGLIGVVWHQMSEKMRDHKEACDKDIEALWAQIGRDSHSGMRKIVHSVESLPAQFAKLDRDVEQLIRRGER